jgi:hypothetical protein
MVTIVTRAGKGERLTHNEVDANFTNLQEAIEATTPEAFGAAGDGTTDDTEAVNSALAALRAAGDSETDTYGKSVSLDGKRYKVTGPLNMTNLRSGYGSRFGDGAIVSDATSGIVLDMTDTYRSLVQNLTISTYGTNDYTDTGPAVGILQQRPSNGRVSGNNWFNNVNVVGVFDYAALMNYASEACEYTGLFLQNRKRSEDAAALWIQRTSDNVNSSGVEIASSFTTNATGAESNIRALFTSLVANRSYSTDWTITAISKANPAVFTYSVGSAGIAPEVGDVVVIAKVTETGTATVTWASVIKDYVFTIAAVTPATAITGTFTLTGVDTSAVTTDYTASSATVFYRTGPGIRLVHRDRLQIEHFYVATYGSHGVEIAFGGNPYRFLKLHGHVEGGALQAWAKFVCGPSGDRILQVYDLDVLEHASHINEDFFTTNATTGRVELYRPKIVIESIRADNGPGEPTVTLRGNIFDDPSKFYLYDADIVIGDSGYMNPVADFGHFSGRIHYLDTDEVVVVPRRVHVEASTLKYYDDFDQWSLAPYWNTRLGTDGSCAAALTSTSSRGGRLLIASGADAAGTFAANGVQVHGRAIHRAEAGPIDVEFGCRPVSNTANMAYFVGLTDEDQALEMPAVLDTLDVMIATASNFVGFLFDTAADAPQEFWHAVSKKSTGTEQKLNLNLAPTLFVAAQTTRMRIIVNDDGDADFYMDGVLVASFTNAVATTETLCPIVAVFSRAATSRKFSVDHFQIFGWK